MLSCPGRGAALLRCSAEPGPRPSKLDPGSAAQRSASALRPGNQAHAEFPRQAPAAADPDAVLRVGPDLFAAASVARRSGAGDGGRGARSRRHRPYPRAIPARSAGPGAICLLGQGRPVGRSRRVPAHQGAGARPDRAKTAGDDAAGVDGDHHRVPDRHSRRHRLGGEEGHRVGLWRQPVRAVGHLDAEFLARHHADLPVLDRARLAAGLRLRAAHRRLARQPCRHHHARLRARQRHRGGPDAAYPKRHAAGAGERLRPHRPRQGTYRTLGHPQARHAQRADAGDYAGRARTRHAAVGRGADRADLLDSRLRQADRRCRVQPRLCGRAGRRAGDRDHLHHAEPDRRHRLYPRQSAAEGRDA